MTSLSPKALGILAIFFVLVAILKSFQSSSWIKKFHLDAPNTMVSVQVTFSPFMSPPETPLRSPFLPSNQVIATSSETFNHMAPGRKIGVPNLITLTSYSPEFRKKVRAVLGLEAKEFIGSDILKAKAFVSKKIRNIHRDEGEPITEFVMNTFFANGSSDKVNNRTRFF